MHMSLLNGKPWRSARTTQPTQTVRSSQCSLPPRNISYSSVEAVARPAQGRRRPQNRPLLNFSAFTRADTAPDVVERAGVVVAALSMVCWDVQGRQVPKLVVFRISSWCRVVKALARVLTYTGRRNRRRRSCQAAFGWEIEPRGSRIPGLVRGAITRKDVKVVGEVVIWKTDCGCFRQKYAVNYRYLPDYLYD